MIKKGIFLLGIILMGIPFWLAIKGPGKYDLVDKINKDIALHPSAAGPSEIFTVLDGSQYKGKIYPWLGYPVTILYEDQLLGEGDNVNQPPDEFRIKELLLKHQGKKRIIFQIDSWKITTDSEEDELAELHIYWYLQVLEWAREVLPGANLGFFGMPYSPWFALQKPNIRMRDYQKILARLTPVFKASDSLYPTFFVQYGDSEHLFYTMSIQLYIAKSFDKPVYPILWQRGMLQDSVEREILPSELINRQCQFVKKYADGMVWWSELGEPWVDGWYSEVKEQCFE